MISPLATSSNPARLDAATLPPGMQLDALTERLRSVEGCEVRITSVSPLRDVASDALKTRGYGWPLLIRYVRGPDRPRAVVLRTFRADEYGHDRRADRFTLAILAADSYDALAEHAKLIDVGAIGQGGVMSPIPCPGEPYLLTEYAEGTLYAADLRRVEHEGIATPIDLERARLLARTAAEIHRPVTGLDRMHYVRHVRDVVGSGEGIFGIVDGYPTSDPAERARLEAIEAHAVAWRHKLRRKSHRLRRIHGDFHPFNVLFHDGSELSLIDTSRGSKGDPADDVAAMSVNYVFGAARKPECWQHGMRPLWRIFWQEYLQLTQDDELTSVMAPHWAWRSLVVSSPAWYPTLSERGRTLMLSLAERSLARPHFDIEQIDADVSEWAKHP